jgi:hypothetical protein
MIAVLCTIVGEKEIGAERGAQLGPQPVLVRAVTSFCGLHKALIQADRMGGECAICRLADRWTLDKTSARETDARSCVMQLRSTCCCYERQRPTARVRTLPI